MADYGVIPDYQSAGRTGGRAFGANLVPTRVAAPVGRGIDLEAMDANRRFLGSALRAALGMTALLLVEC